jgi:hypothetical protein
MPDPGQRPDAEPLDALEDLLGTTRDPADAITRGLS